MLEVSRFWRDSALPFVEARVVGDGRQVCHAAHSHESFSLGVITGGRSTYVSGHDQFEVAAGSTVLINPGVIHACNPVSGLPWSYIMLFIDTPWLASVGLTLPSQRYSAAPGLYQQVLSVCAALFDPDAADREQRLRAMLCDLPRFLGQEPASEDRINPRLEAAAAFIRAHRSDPLTLEDIATACGLSRAYLIRAFGKRFGLTPHGYLLDQRVQLARSHLRHGQSIAEAAQSAGFADQSHLQRAFKRHLAATPGHYRQTTAFR